MSKNVDQIMFDTLCFLGALHDCMICKEVVHQVNGKGKRRTFCNKYKQSIHRVRFYCVDRFPGFNTSEINDLEKQFKAGKCHLVIKGVVA
jgi:hypothetical protein